MKTKTNINFIMIISIFMMIVSCSLMVNGQSWLLDGGSFVKKKRLRLISLYDMMPKEKSRMEHLTCWY